MHGDYEDDKRYIMERYVILYSERRFSCNKTAHFDGIHVTYLESCVMFGKKPTLYE